jgi:hypothetical protein
MQTCAIVIHDRPRMCGDHGIIRAGHTCVPSITHQREPYPPCGKNFEFRGDKDANNGDNR